MAETVRTRTVANKGRRRGGGHMTAKQIKYFGTPRQKAALRSRHSRARANSRRAAARAQSRSNRAKRAKANRSHSHRNRSRSNRGEIIGFTLPNTGRRRGARMAKSNRKNKAKGPRHHHRKRHHAGGSRRHVMNRRRSNRGRRNQGSMGGIGHIVTNAVFVIAGALGSKLLTQMVLGTNNTGLIGYAGNAIAGGAMWFVTEKIMRNRVASEGIIAGTAVQIILRLINDYTPFGQYVSQLGMGDYQAQSFVTPQVLTDPWNSAQIRIPGAWLPPPPPPPATVSAATAAAGVSGFDPLYGGRASLY